MNQQKIIDIEFSQPKYGLESTESPEKSVFLYQQKKRREQVWTIFPKSAVLATCSPQHFAGDSSVSKRLPRTITRISVKQC